MSIVLPLDLQPIIHQTISSDRAPMNSMSFAKPCSFTPELRNVASR